MLSVLFLACGAPPELSEGACLAPEAGWYDDTGSHDVMAPGEFSFEASGLDAGILAELPDAPRCSAMFGQPEHWYSLGEWVLGTTEPIGITGPATLEYDLLRSWWTGFEGQFTVHVDGSLAFAAVALPPPREPESTPLPSVTAELGPTVARQSSRCSAITWHELQFTAEAESWTVGYDAPATENGYRWANAGTRDVKRARCSDVGSSFGSYTVTLVP